MLSFFGPTSIPVRHNERIPPPERFIFVNDEDVQSGLISNSSSSGEDDVLEESPNLQHMDIERQAPAGNSTDPLHKGQENNHAHTVSEDKSSDITPKSQEEQTFGRNSLHLTAENQQGKNIPNLTQKHTIEGGSINPIEDQEINRAKALAEDQITGTATEPQARQSDPIARDQETLQVTTELAETYGSRAKNLSIERKPAEKRVKEYEYKLVPLVQKRSFFGDIRKEDRAPDWYRGPGAEDESVRMKRVRIKGRRKRSFVEARRRSSEERAGVETWNYGEGAGDASADRTEVSLVQSFNS
jgi:hypothetical protein